MKTGRQRKLPSMPQKVRSFVTRSASRYPQIERVLPFGSRARGDARERSDFDLAVMLLLTCVFPLLFAEAQPSVKDLIHQLQSGDSDEKERSAKALGDMGPAAKPAIGALQKALNDEFPFVRLHSIDTLANIGSPALPALTAAM